MLHAEQSAEDVCVEGGGVALGGLVGYGAGLPFGSCVIDSYVETTKSRDRFVDHVAHVVFVAHIRTHEVSFSARLAEFGDQLFPLFVAPTGNNNLSAFLGKGQRGGASDTCQCASNQNNFGIH